jgi:hypothetical protein
MQVSFTGFKNVGFVPSKIYPTIGKDENGQSIHSDDIYVDINTINLQLTDDSNGKDLSEYKNQIRGLKNKYEMHPVNSDFLNISTLKGHIDEDGVQIEPEDSFAILVNGKPLPIKDENLPIISYIAKLLKRVQNQKEHEFVVNNDYISGDDVGKSMVLGHDLSKTFDSRRDYMLGVQIMHNPSQVHDGAKNILDDITEKMIEYFS